MDMTCSSTPTLTEEYLNTTLGYREQNIPTDLGEKGIIRIDWRIRVVDGFGSADEAQTALPIMWTASHVDLDRIQLKAFHRILLMNRFSEQFVPVVGLNVLRNLWRAPDSQSLLEQQAKQVTDFLRFTFRESKQGLRIVDEKVELFGQPLQWIIDVTNFHDTFNTLVPEFKDNDKLEANPSLDKSEKELLRTYFDKRGKLAGELEKYPYHCWILAILNGLKPRYLVADASNAGLQVLMKYIARVSRLSYFPKIIVLPHPVTLSGNQMIYFDSSNKKELGWADTLRIHDSPFEVMQKLGLESQTTIGARRSWKYMSFIVNNIIYPFGKDIFRRLLKGRDLEALVRKYGDSRELLKLIFKAYWEFIEPYYLKTEEICKSKETMVRDVTKNLEILKVLASRHYLPVKVLDSLAGCSDRTVPPTRSEIASLVADSTKVQKKERESLRTGVYGAIKDLEKVDLLARVSHPSDPEKDRYILPSNFKTLELRLQLNKKQKGPTSSKR